MNTNNLLKCKYCDYTVPRFRGTKRRDARGMSYGERQLRLHVGQSHTALYVRNQGLVRTTMGTCWTLDTLEDAP